MTSMDKNTDSMKQPQAWTLTRTVYPLLEQKETFGIIQFQVIIRQHRNRKNINGYL